MTDWTAYNLPAIWTMLRAEDTCTASDRVAGWEALAGDVREQLTRLRAARARLAEAWPPEENDSARAFLDRMDLVAASMQETLTRAEDIRAGLRGIVEALGEAQAAVRPLAEERAVVSSDLIPRWLDHAEDEYDAKARAAMQRAEAAVADHTAQLEPPSLFEGRDDLGGRGGDFDPGTSGSAPAVPVPVPVPHDPPELSAGALPGGSADASLAGVAPPAGAGSAPVLPSPGTSGGALPGSVIGAAGVIGAGGLVAGAAGAAGVFGPITGPSRRGGAGLVPPAGRDSTGVRPPAGPRPAPGAAAAAAGSAPAHPIPPMSGGRRPGHRAEDAGAAGGGVADETWEVREGVAPIIRPSRRRARHDPGPGVIGGAA
ncbi:hypothetical protein [Actinoplanes sp. RD1]|uniref:hypothetical protein n=1 Tax=Actinoplanes sp. RD1 TaxID=3064538 RepID=UPI0027421661|nr:hypothetical protein [Actinoplanes sp. RD1]